MECDGALQYLRIVLIFRKCVKWINVIFPPQQPVFINGASS